MRFGRSGIGASPRAGLNASTSEVQYDRVQSCSCAFGMLQGKKTLCIRTTRWNNIRLAVTRIPKDANACGTLNSDVEKRIKKPNPLSAATNSATTEPMTASVTEIRSALKI